MLKKKKKYLIPTIGFSIIILLGALLLMIPLANNEKIRFRDALFTSVSSVSNTGLTTIVPVHQFTFLGQFVMAFLMELGSIGFIIYISYFWVKRGKKISVSDNEVINESLSGNDIGEVKEYTKFIISMMLKIEFVGVVLLSLVFIPIYGPVKGLWQSVFHTISSFSNSGFDVIGENSVIDFSHDIYFQIVTIILMISGSIGMIVLADMKKNSYFNVSRFKLQTKLVLIFTAILLFAPVFLLKVLNPQMGWLNLLFMSASSRSTGFAIVDMNSFNDASKFLISILMFIGGGPSSTAGGIRMMSFAIITLTIGETLCGKTQTIIFWKKIPESSVRKAFTVFFIALLFVVVGIITFSYVSGGNIIDVMVQCISAISNTGFSVFEASEIDFYGEVVLMLMMYIGRIGLLTLPLILFDPDEDSVLVRYPEENVII